MDRVSRALLAVRTLAKVALRIPITQAQDDISAPNTNVMPLLFSTNRLKTTARTATTMRMVRYSVFMNVFAPERMIPAISAISAVPSGILRILR